MKFTLLEGTHIEDGNEYKNGDTFDSKKQLDKVFKNRFKEVKEITEKKVINIALESKNSEEIAKKTIQKKSLKSKKKRK